MINEEGEAGEETKKQKKDEKWGKVKLKSELESGRKKEDLLWMIKRRKSKKRE